MVSLMVSNILIVLWKDLIVRKNHYLATLSEILIPVIIIILANAAMPKLPKEINNDPLIFEPLKLDKCIARHTLHESISYEPFSPFLKELMSGAACHAGYKKSSVSNRELSNNNFSFSIGLKFEIDKNDSKVPQYLNYTIYPKHKIWSLVNKLWRNSGFSLPRYSSVSMLKVIELQRAIDISYMNMKNISTPKLYMENTNLFSEGPNIFSIAIYFALFIAFSLMVPPTISRVVEEKITGAKELMVMMGVKKWQLWIAKFLDSFIFQMITVFAMTIFLYIPLKEDSNVLEVSPALFCLVILYGLIGVICFFFFISCFFQKSSLAVYIAELIWTFSFMFNNFISSVIDLPAFVEYIMCLFPHVTLMNGISILLDYNFYGKEIKFTEKVSLKNGNLSLFTFFIFASLDIVIFAILTWYIEQVKPGKYGVPKSYGFCFKKKFWVPEKTIESHNEFGLKDRKLPDGYEVVPSTLKTGIRVENVSKIFKSPDKGLITAVDNISIDFYHGEISALLGHNGAGKTTTFSIITGLTYPTSGKVLINSQDLASNINEARKGLGLCPQQDLLFNDLTAIQILKFYGVIKGLPLKNAIAEADDLLKKLKLENVKNTKTSDLSGGQKRKISLAIALIGGSEVLILDEPSSGMDPEIRREIWEILLSLKGTKTILITTHFMEEADALCDRIAIMNEGKIKCYGSPMYLKSNYGKGYVLSIVINDIGDTSIITNYIKQFIPSANFRSQNIRSLAYELPESEVDNFPLLLNGLDQMQVRNEIISYSISVASLEDVFLKLRCKSEKENKDCVDSPTYVKLSDKDDCEPKKILNAYLYVYQFWALFLKKIIFFRRKFVIYLLYSVLPLFIIITTSLFSQGDKQKFDLNTSSTSDSVVFSTDLYSPFLILYSNPENISAVESFPSFARALNCNIRKVSNVKEEIRRIYNDNFYVYSKYLHLGVTFTSNEIKILHNDRAVHMIPIGLNLIHNFMFTMNNVTNDSIKTSISPRFIRENEFFIPPPVAQCEIDSIPDFTGIQTFFYFLSPLKEDIYGAKDIQLMITPTVLYWFSHLLFDFISFVVYMIAVCLWFGFSAKNNYMMEYADEVFGGFALWGIGMLLLTYTISTFIRDEARAFSTSVVIYIIFTFVMNTAINGLNLPTIFRYLHPTTILQNGFTNLCSGITTHFIQALVYYDLILFAYIILKDCKWLELAIHWTINKIVKQYYGDQGKEDEMVEKEKYEVEEIIKKENTSGFALVVNGLKRWYWRPFKFVPAVRGTSFKVNKGECFGLLGVNGAGKTSTFKMLTGAIPSSEGTTYISSSHLTPFNRQRYLFQIGYCPQSGGLIPTFKGRELLTLFARLRGIQQSDINSEVAKWLEKFELSEYADRKCGTYSGGNQRKLSTAVSLIGNNPLVFLDEPTSGVDPASRRVMWNVINGIKEKGQSLILTSHSMDECEALCSRIAIMVSGRFRCIGEITTLKNKFGQGYCIQLKISSEAPRASLDSFKQVVVDTFGNGCTLIDEHVTIMQYHVQNNNLSWAEIFSKLKRLKEDYKILESYTASETTLENIFIYFARNN